MPDQSAHLADFRKSGNRLRCFASFYVGRQVLQGVVLAALPVGNVQVITYGTPVGDYLDVEPGFRVDFFTAGGVFKGRTRVRFGNTITPNVFPIRETPPGAIAIAIGDIVRVYRDMRLSDLLVAALETFPPDGTPYSDQGSNPFPLPVSGGAWAGWTTMLPALMTGEDSATVDPDSVSPVTHNWLPDGLTISVGSATTENISLTGTWGEYLVEHQVTDPDNGKTLSQFVPVVIHDAAHPPYKVEIESLPNDEIHGGSARVRMLQNVPLTDVPDGALCILWKEETIAGVRQSFGARAPGRSHVLLVGILRREEGEGDGETGAETLTFEVISPMARLDEIMGFGHVMISNQTPDAWHLKKSLTVRRGIIQALQHYTTFFPSGNDLVFTSTYADEDYSGFFLDGGTPLTQARDLAASLDCRIIEDRRGRFEVQMIPELVALSDRAALPITLTLTARDLLRWRYTRSHWRPVNRIEVQGFIAGRTFTNGIPDNLPIFSEWPGKGTAVGTLTSTIQKKIVSATNSQQVLNERAGRLGAAQDGIYVDADGALQMALDLELTLRGAYDVFDFYDELVEVQTVTRKRGLDFDGYQYVFAGSDITFEGGKAETTIRLRTCTNGTEGSTYVPPVENLPPYTPPDLVPHPTPPPGVILGIGVNTLAAVNNDGYTYLFANWQGTPVVTRYSLTALGMQGTLRMFIVDAFSPLYLGTGTTVNGVLITTSHAYRLLNIGNIGGTASLANEYAFRYAPNYRSMQSERGLQGFFAVVSHDNFGTLGTDIEVTLDAGITWTRYAAVFPSYSGQNNYDGCYVSARVPGKIITSGSISGAALAQLKLVTAYGATQAALDANLLDLIAGDIHIPFQDAAESTIYHGGTIAGVFYTFKTVNGVRADISPIYLSVPWGPSEPFSLKTCDINSNYLLVCARSASANEYAVFLSADAGASYAVLAEGLAAAMPYRSATFAGNSPDYSFHWGNAGAMGISTDGVTIEDKRGNLPTDFPAASRFFNICGVN